MIIHDDLSHYLSGQFVETNRIKMAGFGIKQNF